MTQIKWNWQKDDWTKFIYDNKEIEKLERDYAKQSGFSLGIARHLSCEDQNDLIVELVSNEAIKTSEIEGEFLDRKSLQASIRREFGLGILNHHSAKPAEAGIDPEKRDALIVHLQRKSRSAAYIPPHGGRQHQCAPFWHPCLLWQPQVPCLT